MTVLMRLRPRWLTEPSDSAYAGALAGLIAQGVKRKAAMTCVRHLHKAAATKIAIADLFRASVLPLLKVDDSRVVEALEGIHGGAAVEPFLLVRSLKTHRVLVLGGHARLCAIWHLNRRESLACRIVTLRTPKNVPAVVATAMGLA